METTATIEKPPTVKEFNQPGYKLCVAISADKIECRCSYLPVAGISGSNMTLAELRESLAKSLVRFGIDEEALQNFAAKAMKGEEQHDVLLASGIPGVPGVDGWLSYSVKASLELEHGNDHNGNVDFHNVQTFINVSPEEEIGRIIPPEPGVEGKSLVGVPIRPQPSKAFKLKIGKNIRTEDDGAVLIATSAGRLCVTSGEISVEEEYSIRGNVDFSVGSIVFNGVVNISGDVLDDFDITATKGIKIGGNIGACKIQCDGDMEVGGMDGQTKGSITCGGSLQAKFLHDCTVTCAGDLTVEVEMYNCSVYVLGKIIIKQGGMSGGNYVALGGIETRKVGSPSSVRTRLTAGMDYKDVETLERLYSDLNKINDQLENAPMSENADMLRATRTDIYKKMKAIRTKWDERANAKINVFGMLYENVLITLGNSREEIKDQLRGPMSIIENTIEGGLRYLSMSGLDVKAADTEQAIIKQQERQTSS